MTDLYKEELIRKFLEEELQGDEITAFQELFHRDPGFAREVKLATDTEIALKTIARINLKQPQHELLKEPIPIQRYLLIAASIIILVGFGVAGYLYYTRYTITPDQLYAANFKPPESFSMEGERGWEQYKPDSSSSQEKKFHYAIHLMQRQDYQKAIEILIRLVNETPNLFWDQSEWYLSLCYLKTNQLDLAKDHLEFLIANNTKFSADAAEIVGQLNRIKP